LAISFTARAAEIQTIQKNERALFSGVLVPEETYRDILVDASDKIYLKTQFEECLDKNESFQTVDKYTYFGAGTMVGIVAGIVLMIRAK
jgi:hypothetical protein